MHKVKQSEAVTLFPRLMPVYGKGLFPWPGREKWQTVSAMCMPLLFFEHYPLKILKIIPSPLEPN